MHSNINIKYFDFDPSVADVFLTSTSLSKVTYAGSVNTGKYVGDFDTVK